MLRYLNINYHNITESNTMLVKGIIQSTIWNDSSSVLSIFLSAIGRRYQLYLLLCVHSLKFSQISEEEELTQMTNLF